MGGGDWDQKQMQQQIQLDKAYTDIPNKKFERPAVTKTVASVEVKVPEPDLFDKAYVGLRTIIPGWMMGLFIAVGMITMATVIFKKQLKSLIILWGKSLE
jgi:hypothetical protein